MFQRGERLASAGSVEELIILSFGLSLLMGVAFLWLALKDEKTSNTLRVGLMQMGLLFMVNSIIFVLYYLRTNSEEFGLSQQIANYLLSVSSLLNLLTILQILILFTIFPMPVFSKRENTIKFAGVLIIQMFVFILAANFLAGGLSGIYLAFIVGEAIGIVFAALIVARWYLLYRSSEDPQYRNVAISTVFLFFAFLGSTIMNWPYAVFFDKRDLGVGSYIEEGLIVENIAYLALSFNGTLVAAILIVIVIKEGMISRDKRDNTLLALSTAFLLFGLANYMVQLLGSESSEFASLWNYFVVTGTFGLIRPLILVLVALRFNLFDLTDEKTRNHSRIIALLIITVWASAFFEIIQAFIPMPQLLSAAMIGVFLAFAIGWEEKIFESLADKAEEKVLPNKEDCFEDEDPYRLMMLTIAVVVITTGLGILSGGMI